MAKKDEAPKNEEKTPEERIEELQLLLKESQTDVLRARADFENYRKRKEEELVQSRDRAIVSFVLDLLPSIDNFEMSLKMTDNKEMFVKGVEMIHKNLIDTLKEHHFEDFEPQVGEEFNPHFHEPMLIENKEANPGEILGVLRKGFKRKDEIVRPARVQVVKEKED